jgi:Fe-S-cluster-containing hydrogenase component 2
MRSRRRNQRDAGACLAACPEQAIRLVKAK